MMYNLLFDKCDENNVMHPYRGKLTYFLKKIVAFLR